MDSSRLRLGWLLPALLFVGTAADLLCRAVPPEKVAFRAWEALTSRPSATGPFQASARFETAAAYGDLASSANLPQHRHAHAEKFTTDDQGFRNAPRSGTPDLLVVGDSFGAGCAVDDDQLFPVLLEKDLGRVVYNASGFPPTIDEIRGTIRRLGMTRGTVIYEHVERWGAPPRFQPSRIPVSKPQRRRLDAWMNYSPLEIWCKRAHRRLEDGTILPNQAAREVIPGTLPSGETMLFLRFERELKRTLADADRAADHWLELASELKKDGLELAVVLVPNKSTVYGPLAREGAEVSQGRAFLRRIEERLRASGVRALDLSPSLDRAARSDPALLYRLDDTHWTPQGHRVAATAIEEMLARPP